MLLVYSIFEPAACFKPNWPKRVRGGQDKPIARGEGPGLVGEKAQA